MQNRQHIKKRDASECCAKGLHTQLHNSPKKCQQIGKYQHSTTHGIPTFYKELFLNKLFGKQAS